MLGYLLQEVARLKAERQKQVVMTGSVDMLANLQMSQEAPTKLRPRGNGGGPHVHEPEAVYQGEVLLPTGLETPCLEIGTPEVCLYWSIIEDNQNAWNQVRVAYMDALQMF